MSYVATEILGLLAAAAALGVVLGWAIFGRRGRGGAKAAEQLRDEKAKLEAELKTQSEARKVADLKVAEADARVAVFQGRVQQSETRAAEVARQLAELSKQLEEQAKQRPPASDDAEGRDQRIAALEAQLRVRDAEVARLAGGGKLAAQTEVELKTQIGDRERTIERLRGELEALRAQASPDAPKIAELQAEVAELRATLVATAGVAPATDVEKDQTIARLTEEVTGLRAAYEAAEQTIDEQDAAIDKLTREAVQTQQKLAQTEAWLGASRAQPTPPPAALAPALAPPTPLPSAPPVRARPPTVPAMPALDLPYAPASDSGPGFVRRPTTPAMSAVAGVRSGELDAPVQDTLPAVRRPTSSVLTTMPGGAGLGTRPDPTSPRAPFPAPPPGSARRPTSLAMPAVAPSRSVVEPPPAASPTGGTTFRAARALGPPDDLKRIRGIGPATEKRLNEVGVTTWAQVAAFTPNEIPAIADIAKVSIDKIRPWIDQALALVSNAPDE